MRERWDLVGGVGVEAGGGIFLDEEPRVAEQRYSNVAPLGLPACGPAGHVSCRSDGLVQHGAMHLELICVRLASSSVASKHSCDARAAHCCSNKNIAIRFLLRWAGSRGPQQRA